MKSLLGPLLLALACCSHAAESQKNEPKEHFKEGWQNIKEGGREVAVGLEKGVEKGAKKAGAAIQAMACPIAADTSAGFYYAKDSPGYEKMLTAEKSDVRECFVTEAGAREKGYTLVR